MTGNGGTPIVQYSSKTTDGANDGTRCHTSDGRMWSPVRLGEQLWPGVTRGVKIGEVMYEKGKVE